MQRHGAAQEQEPAATAVLSWAAAASADQLGGNRGGTLYCIIVRFMLCCFVQGIPHQHWGAASKAAWGCCPAMDAEASRHLAALLRHLAGPHPFDGQAPLAKDLALALATVLSPSLAAQPALPELASIAE
jgi:hypothetical protein